MVLFLAALNRIYPENAAAVILIPYKNIKFIAFEVKYIIL